MERRCTPSTKRSPSQVGASKTTRSRASPPRSSSLPRGATSASPSWALHARTPLPPRRRRWSCTSRSTTSCTRSTTPPPRRNSPPRSSRATTRTGSRSRRRRGTGRAWRARWSMRSWRGMGWCARRSVRRALQITAIMRRRGVRVRIADARASRRIV